MNIENNIALHFIMQDDLFILNKDKEAYSNAAIALVETDRVDELLPAFKIPDVAEPTAVAQVKPVEFNFMGKKGDMLILVHYPQHEHINETHLTALDNILKRKEISIGDITILNMDKNTNASFEVLMEYFNPQKLLIMGEKALPAGITKLYLNQPQSIEKKMVLYSFSFDEMMSSDDNKRTFWGQMKRF